MRIQVNARNRGYEFDAHPGEKVLYAGLRAGIALVTGSVVAQPATSRLAVATEAWMKTRLVSFMVTPSRVCHSGIGDGHETT